MTVEREYGNIVFICDECGDDLNTGTKDWEEAKEIAGDEGWVPIPDGNTWIHCCPDCAQRF